MISHHWVVSVLCATVLALPCGVEGQQRPTAEHAMALSLGFAGLHQRDEYLSPVTYRGSIPSANLLFERRGPRSLWSLEGVYGMGHTNSQALPRDVWQHVARMSFTWLRVLASPRPDRIGWRVYGGGALSTFGEITEVTARDPASNYSYRDGSWYAAHSLDLATRAELTGVTRSLAIAVGVPTLGLISRPNNGKEYNADNEQVTRSWPRALARGRPEFLWSRRAVSGEAELRQHLGGRLQLLATYEFTYASSERPVPVGLYMNRFMVGLARSF